MSKYLIYHNPRCTKSRQSLKALEEAGVEFEVKLYLEDGLKRDEVEGLKKLLDLPVIEFVRVKEKEFKEAGLSKQSGDQDLLKALTEVPKLLERPIIVRENSEAVVGRPVEVTLEFFR